MAATGPMTVAAILVAAGSGERLGRDVPKAFVAVAGRSLLSHCALRFLAHPAVRHVVVLAPESWLAEAAEQAPGTIVRAGGATRQLSVAAGLAALAPDVDVVLVHDVARAFVPAELITRVLEALSLGASAVVPTVPVTDTIRRVDETGRLGGPVDRSRLAAVQTPQGFARAVLDRAHAAAGGVEATDDASLVEALGVEIVAVHGSDDAFKITTPADLVRAELVAR
jgi:2-C-methyl-D-erythritol 4-phosphate cytidylyltransferase